MIGDLIDLDDPLPISKKEGIQNDSISTARRLQPPEKLSCPTEPQYTMLSFGHLRGIYKPTWEVIKLGISTDLVIVIK